MAKLGGQGETFLRTSSHQSHQAWRSRWHIARKCCHPPARLHGVTTNNRPCSMV